ncbi:MAG: VOC family protein [Woeseiaceae bacterium]|nr:VOC family protein [Woeseiaceae bacterium]
MKRSLFALLVPIIFGSSAFSQEHLPEPQARLSGTTIVTSDLEQSVHFYSTLLGFRETRIRQLTGSANLAVYGISDEDATVRYTALLPAEWSKDNVYLSSLNFVEIVGAVSSAQERDADRAPMQSEIILAYRVENIEEILRRAKALETPIVSPVLPSESGKSVTATMLDPNGIRVYLYEYVEDPE